MVYPPQKCSKKYDALIATPSKQSVAYIYVLVDKWDSSNAITGAEEIKLYFHLLIGFNNIKGLCWTTAFENGNAKLSTVHVSALGTSPYLIINSIKAVIVQVKYLLTIVVNSPWITLRNKRSTDCQRQ